MSYHNQYYDMETEIETIELLKNQNKRIQELFDENVRKNELLAKFQSENIKLYNINQEASYEIDNLRSHLSSIEEKLVIMEKNKEEKVNQLNEELKNIRLNEKKLQGLVSQNEKEKTININNINEYKKKLEEYEEDNQKYKNEIKEKNQIINTLTAEKEDMANKIKNYFSQIENLKQKINKTENEFNDKVQETISSKYLYDQDVQKLVDLIKQQNNELKILDEKNKNLEKVNIDIQDKLEKLQYERDEIGSHIQSLKETLSKYENIENRLKSSENYIQNLNDIIELERKKNIDLSESLNTLNIEYYKLKDKYCGEKSPEYLLALNNDKEKLILTLQKELDELKQTVIIKDKSILDSENEFSNYINYIHSCLITMINWIETYYGSSVERDMNVKVQKLKVSENRNKYHSKLKKTLDTCFNILFEKRNIIISYYDNYDNIINDTRNELHKVYEERDYYEKENQELKLEIQNLNDELENQNFKMEKMMKELDNVQNSLSSINKIKNDITCTSKQYLEYLLQEMKIISEELKASKLKNFSEIFEKGFSFHENITEQIKSNLKNLVDFVKIVLKEHEAIFTKYEEFSKVRFEFDKLNKEYYNLKKSYHDKIDKIIIEKDNTIKGLEKELIEKTTFMENDFKKKFDNLKNINREKEENLISSYQDNKLLMSQLKLTEKTLEDLKLIKKESENEFKKKNQELLESNKKLETDLDRLNNKFEKYSMDIKKQESALGKKSSELNLIRQEYDERNQKLQIKIEQLNLENMNLKEEIEFFSKRKKPNDNIDISELNERLKLAEQEIKLKDQTIKKLINEKNK